jgi:hypothetical protein
LTHKAICSFIAKYPVPGNFATLSFQNPSQEIVMNLNNIMYPRDAETKLGLDPFINGRSVCFGLMLVAVIGAFALLILPLTEWAQYFKFLTYLYAGYICIIAIALWFGLYKRMDVHKLYGLYNSKAWGEEQLIYMVDRICEAKLEPSMRLTLLKFYLEQLQQAPSIDEHLNRLLPKTRTTLDIIVQVHIKLMSDRIATIHSATEPPESVGETQSLADEMASMMGLRRTLKPPKATPANAPFGE